MGIIGPGSGGSVVGAWTAVTLEEAVFESVGAQTLGVRTEDSGNTARLRGKVKVKVAEGYLGSKNNAIITIPAAFKPPAQIAFHAETLNTGATAGILELLTTGVLTGLSSLANGNILCFDGLSWNLT